MATTTDKKYYNNADSSLQAVNKNFTSLSEADIKEYNVHFYKVINFLIEKMKETDPLFKEMYTNRTHFAGSFFDGLKVSKPEEFDIDLSLGFPKLIKLTPEMKGGRPGFMKIKITGLNELEKDKKWNTYKQKIAKWLDGNSYLKTDSVRNWFHSVIQQTFNKFEISKNKDTAINGEMYNLQYSAHGPAFMVKVKHRQVFFDIDLVPVLEFKPENWPNSPYRQQHELPDKAKNLTWFLVPKSLKNASGDIYWRASFSKQERVIIKDINSFKPAIRLMKKFRDTQNYTQIASYYIKTMFLWQIKEQPAEFWMNSLSYIFVTMLKKFEEYMRKEKIPFYWYKENNLIESIGTQRRHEIAVNIKKMIADIDANVKTNQHVISKYILTPKEANMLTSYGTPEIINEYPQVTPESASTERSCQVM